MNLIKRILNLFSSNYNDGYNLRVITEDGKVLGTNTSTLICKNIATDEYNHIIYNKRDYLYKTNKGNFFIVAIDDLFRSPYTYLISVKSAKREYAHAIKRYVSYVEAFGVELEEL